MNPFVELHLHLDGSLSPSEILTLAKQDRIKLPYKTEKEISKNVTAPLDCASLNEYLTKFQIPVQVLQSEKNLHDAVYSLYKELHSLGCVYAEVRFAPQLHCRKGLTQADVISASIQGLKDAEKDFKIKGNLILCCMRGANEVINLETVTLAAKFLGQGVCALDLAGAEAIYPTNHYQSLFCMASNMDIPFTIHAGEAAGPGSVRDAINFGAKRIGHCCSAFEDETVIESIKYQKIGVECCVTSNLQTKAVLDFQSHPLWHFLEDDILVSVNSDNMTVSDTNVRKELEQLSSDIRFSAKIEHRIFENSVKTAFLTDEEKQELLSLWNQG